MPPPKAEPERDECEETLLSELSSLLLKPKSEAQCEIHKPRTWVEDVRIDAFGTERRVVILFRDLDRPECLFGYAWGPTGWLEDDPYIASTIVWANFNETLYASDVPGLPEECSSEGINWF